MSTNDISSLNIDDITVAVHRSLRARNIGLRITNDSQVVLVVPRRASVEQAKRFLFSKLSWVRSKLKHVGRLQEEKSRLQSSTDTVYIFGTPHKIVHTECAKSMSVNIQDNILSVICPIKILQKLIIQHLKLTLFEEVTRLSEVIAKEYGFKYESMSLIDSKTKWGSCCSRKTLKFNWKLIGAPLQVIRYVVVHEVCHLKEMNHSPRFYKLVEMLDKNWKTNRLWLKRNAHLLL